MLPRLALATTVVLWASAFPAIRVGLTAFSPFHVALLRYLTASLVLASVRVPPRLARCGTGSKGRGTRASASDENGHWASPGHASAIWLLTTETTLSLPPCTLVEGDAYVLTISAVSTGVDLAAHPYRTTGELHWADAVTNGMTP